MSASIGVTCPACGVMRSKVINSRRSPLGGVLRRRVCIACSMRFTTREVHDGQTTAEKDQIRHLQHRLRTVIRATWGHFDHFDDESVPAADVLVDESSEHEWLV